MLTDKGISCHSNEPGALLGCAHSEGCEFGWVDLSDLLIKFCFGYFFGFALEDSRTCQKDSCKRGLKNIHLSVHADRKTNNALIA